MQRIILHVDLDYFFAQCEELRNPSLKGKPVVVCVYSGRSEDSGAVSTANYEARKLGIKSGIPIAFAKRSASPETVFLPVDFDFYSEKSEQVMEVLRSFADVFEQASVDEAYLDVSSKAKNFSGAKSLAEKIKSELKEKTGLTCSVGIASNKLVAKIASDFLKPSGLTMVEPRKEAEFLAPLKASRLLGIGKKTTERLENLGIKTIGDLANASPSVLTDEFGRNWTDYFKQSALGIDESPLEPFREAQQISRITTLKQDSNEISFIAPVLDFLSEEIIESAKAEQLFFRTISITAITSKLETHTKSKTFEQPTQSLELLKSTARELMQNFLSQNPELKLRRVGARISNFSKKENQKTLAEF